MEKSGFLISFEGGEGCGKSTQVKRFLQYLEERGADFLFTREPGGTEVGEKIRDILLHDKSDLSANTEFLLFSGCFFPSSSSCSSRPAFSQRASPAARVGKGGG